MKKTIFYCLFFLPFVSFAQSIQIQDDFSDGDFTNNPTWTGTVDNFIINASDQLQSNASATSTSYLFTESEAFDNATWEFYVRINYNPTNQNYASIYLVSDVINPDNCNAYYVQIGNSSKEISLYRQQGAQKTKIIDGVDSRVNMNPVEAWIKVTRNNEGEFELYSKVGSETEYTLEGETTDNEISISRYFGVLFRNSGSTGSSYFFDDISIIGDKPIDTIPPTLNNIEIVQSNQLILTFSEPIASVQPSNFHVANIGAPTMAVLSADNTVAILTFSSNFETKRIYYLQTNLISDLEGNEMIENEFDFYISEIPEVGDVVINEIMFENPDDSEEYIELHNNSDKILDLSGLVISTQRVDGTLTTTGTIPSGTIVYPNSHIAFCKSPEDVRRYFEVPSEAQIAAMTFSALNNTSATLLLTNSSKDLIFDQFTYASSWHDASLTSVKGVSLEKINSQLLTQDSQNWQSASENVKFGTPGYKNSSFIEIANIKPRLTSLEMTEDKTGLVLRFSKEMDFYIANYVVAGIGSPAGVSIIDKYTVQLTFSTTFVEKIVYVLDISIVDFSGNPLEITEYKFGVPELPEYGDLIINEVLFENPDGVDEYIEIYNKTEKIIDVSGLKITTLKSDGTQNTGNLIPNKSAIYPYDYLAFCKRPDVVREYYTSPENAQFVSMSIPTLNNSDATLLLVNPTTDEIFDELTYSSKWHHPLVKNAKGVALERINPDLPTQDASSWHSASSEVNYGTPGYKNSQHREITPSTEQEKTVWLNPESFSPDNDGFEDVCFIQYNMGEEGYVANVIIFNAIGQKIYTVCSNSLLGVEGQLSWDGRTNQGKYASVGVYVVFFEAINANNGKRMLKKLPIVVSAR